MVDEHDWRLRGQEEYMRKMEFEYKKFLPRKGQDAHTHCEFCWHKFMENCDGVFDCSTHGFCSADGQYWVCEECFHDFRELLSWRIVDDDEKSQE